MVQYSLIGLSLVKWLLFHRYKLIFECFLSFSASAISQIAFMEGGCVVIKGMGILEGAGKKKGAGGKLKAGYAIQTQNSSTVLS